MQSQNLQLKDWSHLMFLHAIQIRKNRSLDAKKKGLQKVETEKKKGGGGGEGESC